MIRDVVERHVAHGVDEASLAQAKRLFVDTVGCAIAGTHAPEVRSLEDKLAAIDAGTFNLPNGKGLGVHGAAQVFAMAATWDEACEGQPYAHGRPGLPLIAVLLPLAIQRNATLAELLDALVLGYEVGSRVGGWLRVQPGMHVDGNWPSTGVAAGVARFLGLSSEEILQAVDIAACQLGRSLYLPIKTGNTSRNTYLGHSALLGLQSAFASAAGVDAPSDALAHCAQANAPSAKEAPPDAQRLLMNEGYLKPFSAVKHVHYGATAAAKLKDRLNGTRGIASVVLKIYEEATVYCGNRDASTPIQAQFSLTFGLAAMLRFGDIDPSVYSSEKFYDPELRRLEKLIEIQVDRDLTAGNRRGATVFIESNGESLQASVTTVLGDASNPLDDAAVTAKFLRYTTDQVSESKAQEFCESAMSHLNPQVATLWRALSG